MVDSSEKDTSNPNTLGNKIFNLTFFDDASQGFNRGAQNFFDGALSFVDNIGNRTISALQTFDLRYEIHSLIQLLDIQSLKGSEYRLTGDHEKADEERNKAYAEVEEKTLAGLLDRVERELKSSAKYEHLRKGRVEHVFWMLATWVDQLLGYAVNPQRKEYRQRIILFVRKLIFKTLEKLEVIEGVREEDVSFWKTLQERILMPKFAKEDLRSTLQPFLKYPENV